ncbi:hypothetical protein Ari01nite_70710 [Paractinoplanes rishiriensis]|uniref:Uncharacterized protein n=1 Tax=Paractinoplanes rishiriensis TaxID=1050105 RepID=A0A919MTU2_9ACTN|nr:hypothetical protein Ari01nite_70710 [Actinoplanes rishiriensis]
MLTLTACGGADEAGAPTATATTAASAPAATPTSEAAPAAAGADDKKICESVKKAGEEMKAELVKAVQAGEDFESPEAMKKIISGLHEKLVPLAASAGDSEVGAALTAFSEEAAKSLAAKDPSANEKEFEKTGTAITAACKPTGVNAGF